MSFRDRPTILLLMTGAVAGVLLKGFVFGSCRTFFGSWRSFFGFPSIKGKPPAQPTKDENSSMNAVSQGSLGSTPRGNNNAINTVITPNAGAPQINNANSIQSSKKEGLKIQEIDKSPLELRKRFDKKGYVFISQNLATVNTELNELAELMRILDLQILNGCRDPGRCSCNFRHRNCRLFMIRKYSESPELQFFAPSCKGVTNIAPSNSDIKNGTPIHEFIQLFHNKFSDRVTDLANYVNFIVAPERRDPYVVDITVIADPHTGSDKKPEQTGSKYGYGSEEEHTDDEDNDGKIVVDARINKGLKDNKCSLKWHQDRFVEANTNKTHAYDFVAMFVLRMCDITPHKLMIGKIKDDVDVSKCTPEEIQQNVTLLADAMVDADHDSDIGYVIDQSQGYLHKHSDFDYYNKNSRRNVITVRIKYLD